MNIGIFYIDGAIGGNLSLGTQLECMKVSAECGIQDPLIVIINASDGYTYCMCKFHQIKAAQQPTIIVTNAPYLLDNGVVWNKKYGPLVWFQKDGDWVIMQDLTKKELRAGHNIEKIYRNGGLDV